MHKMRSIHLNNERVIMRVFDTIRGHRESFMMNHRIHLCMQQPYSRSNRGMDVRDNIHHNHSSDNGHDEFHHLDHRQHDSNHSIDHDVYHHQFQIFQPTISVIGVGVGGCNALHHMIHSKLEGVQFLAVNTDMQALSQSPCENRVQLGSRLTQGLGTGANPILGARSAIESMSLVLDHVKYDHMVFIAAGLGGGTGTGASEVIGRELRKCGILTVAVVTRPFHFEGGFRNKIAQRGLRRLIDSVDTCVVVPNQNLFRLGDQDISISDALQRADHVLYECVHTVTDLLSEHALVNVDFGDVRTTMREMGLALIGSGNSCSERGTDLKRAEEAASHAINNPLLDCEMRNARGCIINVTGSKDMTLSEVNYIGELIAKHMNMDTNIIWGANVVPDHPHISVSLIVTGLKNTGHLFKDAKEKDMERVR